MLSVASAFGRGAAGSGWRVLGVNVSPFCRKQIGPLNPVTDQPFAHKILMLTLLERSLGARKVDLLIDQPNDSLPIVAVAHAIGVEIQ